MFDPLLSPVGQIVVLGIAGIAVWHLQGRRRPNARLVVQIIVFILMTAVLLQSKIGPTQFQPHAPDGNLLNVAKILWWIHLAWAVIGFLRLYLDLDGRPHEARLVQDLLVAAIYLGVSLAILSFVFGIAIGTLLATSGVIAIILGLALQSTLSDVFSGLALTLGRPYAIGDWIMLTDGIEGRVVENTWRSTQILAAGNNIVVLPNSYLAKIGLTNVSRPVETHQMTLKIRARTTRNPALIVEVLQQALMGANVIVQDPAPVVALQEVDSIAVNVEIYFSVEHIAARITARNEIIDLIYRQCRAEGITLALPSPNHVQIEGPSAISADTTSLRELLRANPGFSRLRDKDLAALEASATEKHYEIGDSLVHHSDPLPLVRILRRGIAIMEYPGIEPIRLAPGDIAGQMAIGSDAPSFRALTLVNAFELDNATLIEVFGRNPELFRDLSSRLSASARDVTAINIRQAHERWHATAFIRAVQSVFRSN